MTAINNIHNNPVTKKAFSDESILALAWKKTNNQIRTKPFYADPLQLDFTAMDLERNIKRWGEDVKSEQFETIPLKLIPAPKDNKWVFNSTNKNGDVNDPKSWESVEESDDRKLTLRPLAHVDIRDQVLATVVMMCLSDIVETMQGPIHPTSDELDVGHKGCSYGHRLQCNWTYDEINKKYMARYNKGNGQYYRKYFEDYRNFHQRPLKLSTYYHANVALDKEIYIVNLDIEKFYEKIDKGILLKKLRHLHKEYKKITREAYDDSEVNEFWDYCSKVLSWKWLEKDVVEAKDKALFDDLPQGLPQGLAASGFLSNAYMIEFDQAINNPNNILGNKLKQHDIIIKDYCRYVDDIRLVIEVDKSMEKDDIKKYITEYFNDGLTEYCDDQMKINDSKTELICFRDISIRYNVSTEMLMIKNMMSGTPDIDTLEQIVGELDGLLALPSTQDAGHSTSNSLLSLSRIRKSYFGVKEKSIKKFAASKILQSLRLKRGFTNLEEEVSTMDGNVTLGEILDEEFEFKARELIYYWSNNPSLSFLLKYGLRLYPHKEVLTPVIEAIQLKMAFHVSDNQDDTFEKRMKERMTTEYIAADLLFACSNFITYEDEREYPKSVDIQAFRETLLDFARWILIEKRHTWYVRQAAIMYLISMEDTSIGIDKLNESEQLKRYKKLYNAMQYKREFGGSGEEWLACGLIIQQIKPNPQKFVSWYIDLMKNLEQEECLRLNLLFFKTNVELLDKVYQEMCKQDNAHYLELPELEKLYLDNIQLKVPSTLDQRKFPLLTIIRSKDNPFIHENALLHLMTKILTKYEEDEKIPSLLNIKVQCEDWSQIQNPKRNNLKVLFEGNVIQEHFPEWLSNKNDKVLYAVGKIIHACITGKYDFTINHYLSEVENYKYKGIYSNAYTRQYGLKYITTNRLSYENVITPWFSELLIKLLQWPGLVINEEYNKVHFETINDLNRVILNRLKEQCGVYGFSMNVPGYIYPVNTEVGKVNDELRIAMVQTELPKMSDFNVKDPSTFNNAYRKRHRGYLASVCKLVSQHLSVHQTANNNGTIDKRDGLADLIILPELSVHKDDIDLLERLSRLTKASIFTGLTFIKDNDNKEINQGLWIVHDRTKTGSKLIHLYQGKKHPTNNEKAMGVKGYRPFQLFIEFPLKNGETARVSSAICYDATDLELILDLKRNSDLFVVSAMNKDVETFDNMVTAMNYHMYQPVVLVNTGEYGGSSAMAPYKGHHKLLTHIHGNHQLGINVFDLNVGDFIRNSNQKVPVKTQPAGK